MIWYNLIDYDAELSELLELTDIIRLNGKRPYIDFIDNYRNNIIDVGYEVTQLELMLTFHFNGLKVACYDNYCLEVSL